MYFAFLEKKTIENKEADLFWNCFGKSEKYIFHCFLFWTSWLFEKVLTIEEKIKGAEKYF